VDRLAHQPDRSRAEHDERDLYERGSAAAAMMQRGDEIGESDVEKPAGCDR